MKPTDKNIWKFIDVAFISGILMAIGFSWIFLMNDFTLAWISLAILVILQFMVDGKRAKSYYREFMNLPPTV